MSCFSIARSNFVDINVLANYAVTSQQTAFPIENAFNRNRRSKLWRSRGYFHVMAGDNVIVFRDAASGGYLEATVAPGHYTSPAAFMAAVDAALEAVGVASYTITQTAQLRFNIASDLSGGATAFELAWSDPSSAGMADMMGYDFFDLTGATNYDADYLRINYPGERIIFDMGIDSIPDDLYIIGPRNEPINISPGAVVKLEASMTNNWDSVPFSQVVPYDSEVLQIQGIADLTAIGYRYWSISFEDQNPDGFIEVGAFFLGTRWNPTRGAVVYPLQSTLMDRSTSIKSEGGQEFTNIREKTQQFSLEWKGLLKADLEIVEELWASYGLAYPFFVSMDQNAAFSTATQRRIKFVKFSSQPSWQLVSTNNFDVSMVIEEQL